MTHPALATMVEAAKKAAQGEWRLVRVTADNLWIDAPCPPDLKPEEHPNSRVSVAWDMSEEDAAHILATQPANILSVAEYVRGLEQYAQAASKALLKVRPLGGSELFTRVGEQYLADPAYCGNEITSIRGQLHFAKLAAALGGKP